MSIFAHIGAVITVLICFYGFAFPDRLTQLVNIGLRLETPIALSEMRATYGAMVAIAVAVIVTQSEAAAMVLGIAWLGAFAGRALSVVVDKSWSTHVAVSSASDLVMFVFLVPLA